jgi:formylglycine-generating enzyme required for sulfatase activity
LEEAGATVHRVTPEQGGDFPQRIEEALADSSHVVLVLTKDAVASPWVQQEIHAAIRLKNQGQLRDILLFQAGPFDSRSLPPLWGVYNVFDATRDYVAACMDLLRTLGLVPLYYAAAPGEEDRSVLPERLADLGYRGRIISEAKIILPPLCDVSSGAFLMGSNKDRDALAQPNELPQYVRDIKAYQICTFPVTVAEYALAVDAGAVSEPLPGGWRPVPWEEQLATARECPVVCVSLQDARSYAAWLTSLTSQVWRLPTEAEWEKAARSADGRIYPWGDSFDAHRCNTAESRNNRPTRVGNYPEGASPYGVQDMAGNVWEWTCSNVMPYPQMQREETKRLDDSSNRVLRGGSWYSDIRHSRAAYRYQGSPEYVDTRIGFRLVRAST